MREEIKRRTKLLAINIFRLMDELPDKPSVWVITRQMGRSAASMGANYRAACRAKSTADFVNKLKIVEEESDETIYWLELTSESGFAPSDKIEPLKREANELLSIVVASIKTLKSKNRTS